MDGEGRDAAVSAFSWLEVSGPAAACESAGEEAEARLLDRLRGGRWWGYRSSARRRALLGTPREAAASCWGAVLGRRGGWLRRRAPLVLLFTVLGTASLGRLWAWSRHNGRVASCWECPVVYYAATACALGGQTLRSRGWSRLSLLLARGAPFRAELEALLASPEFRKRARCPRWTAWDEDAGVCVTAADADAAAGGGAGGGGAGPGADACPAVPGLGSWHDPFASPGSGSSSSSSSCTANLYHRPLLDDAARGGGGGGGGGGGTLYVLALPCQAPPQGDGAHLHEDRGGGGGKWSFDGASGELRYAEAGAVGARCATGRGQYDLVTVEDCSGSSDQRWRRLQGSQYLHTTTWQCLNIAGGYGPQVMLYPCQHDEPNDSFDLEFGVLADRGSPRHCLEALRVDVSKAAGFGGTCTCPDGRAYPVADLGTWCRSLGCIGGTAGPCYPERGMEHWQVSAEVSCQADVLGAAGLAEGLGDPAASADGVCWAGSRPRFVWPGFIHSCPGFAPGYTWWPRMGSFSRLSANADPTNWHPQAFAYGDFPLFYSAFYATGAGDLCRERFGGGPEAALPLADAAPVTLRDPTGLLQERGPLLESTLAWSSKSAVYTEVPGELLGATLFAAPRRISAQEAEAIEAEVEAKAIATDAIKAANGAAGGAAGPPPTTLSSAAPGAVYVWGFNDVAGAESPGLPWKSVGLMRLGPRSAVEVYGRRLAANESLELPRWALWQGGLALQQDDD